MESIKMYVHKRTLSVF